MNRRWNGWGDPAVDYPLPVSAAALSLPASAFSSAAASGEAAIGMTMYIGMYGRSDIDIVGMDDIRPQQDLTLVIRSGDGSTKQIKVRSRIDTPIEVDYYRHGGILPYVLRELMSGPSTGVRSAA